MKSNRSIMVAIVLALTAFAAFPQDTVRLELEASRGTSALGFYQPQQTDLLTARPASLKRVPATLTNPSYAVLPVGPADQGRVYHVVLDEPAGKAAVIWVDANGNGDLTDDAPAEWKGSAGGGYTTWMGGALMRLAGPGAEMEVRLSLYRFDPADPNRKPYARKLFYYRDWVRRGQITLGGKSYAVILSDEKAAGDFRTGATLWIDLNGDGRFHGSREGTEASRPFNVGGTAWEIRDLVWTGDTFRIVPSTAVVAEMVGPPDHRVGQRITSFVAKDMDGRTVRFPEDYRGKIVLLDFWATWCGPCMSEVPNMVTVYKEKNPKGLEILGITLDDGNQAAKVRSVLNQQGMGWPQIYEGGGWGTRLADLYAIDSIPAGYLVDGDTGIILADTGSLRGTSLGRTVDTALARK